MNKLDLINIKSKVSSLKGNTMTTLETRISEVMVKAETAGDVEKATVFDKAREMVNFVYVKDLNPQEYSNIVASFANQRDRAQTQEEYAAWEEIIDLAIALKNA